MPQLRKPTKQRVHHRKQKEEGKPLKKQTLERTREEVSAVIGYIIDSYNAHREVLHETHDQAKAHVVYMYDDMTDWLTDISVTIKKEPEKKTISKAG